MQTRGRRDGFHHDTSETLVAGRMKDAEFNDGNPAGQKHEPIFTPQAKWVALHVLIGVLVTWGWVWVLVWSGFVDWLDRIISALLS